MHWWVPAIFLALDVIIIIGIEVKCSRDESKPGYYYW